VSFVDQAVIDMVEVVSIWGVDSFVHEVCSFDSEERKIPQEYGALGENEKNDRCRPFFLVTNHCYFCVEITHRYF
jgi:hypothetical protein